ncbi:hypothetical protein OVY01_13495 [Robbsia sp. Bb-Pol-6]|uniref:Uncharacterized protein n=1 Tax=Robbsia betulipollinis TaxID=2981849 RepID=A0ABT3ZQR5_9BURK|nr:hypothetical protein [Robbsia betulipollinis]MCY0388233.1 hypothetical protein [Robbsia betulipollinis]
MIPVLRYPLRQGFYQVAIAVHDDFDVVRDKASNGCHQVSSF